MSPAIQYAPYTPPAGVTILWKYTYIGYITTSGTTVKAPTAGKSLYVHSFNGAVTVENDAASGQANTIRIVDTGGDILAEIPVYVPANSTVNVPIFAVPDIVLPVNSVLTAKLKNTVANWSVSDGSLQLYYVEV